MGSQKPAEPSTDQVKDAEALWDRFMAYSKVTGVAVAIILVGLAIAFV